MSDVKWIKITTDIFDDEKILLIESLPDAYAIITVWFKLLCLAGKQNNSGVFMMGRTAYTDKMLATVFRMKEATVHMALEVFRQFGMIEIVDGVITIPNWGKHQNLDQIEARKLYMRNYMKEYRAKQKNLVSGGGEEPRKVYGKASVSGAEEEQDKKQDAEQEADRQTNSRVILPGVTYGADFADCFGANSDGGFAEDARSPFSPPSVEEVARYCNERDNRVNPRRFVDYYAAKGWRMGGTPMHDWRAAVRVWEARESENSGVLPEGGVYGYRMDSGGR